MAGAFVLVHYISWVNLLLLLLSGYSVQSRTIVKSLPGFDGPLPFELETGYVGTGENDNIQTFYYFVESERSPERDPLIIWIPGGPGCSSFGAFFYGNGPFRFDYMKSRGGKPVLQLNPYSWSKISNILYLDPPVGSGFSYAKTSNGTKISDTLSSKHVCDFVRKWLNDHTEFMSNQVYISGVSYSGILVPIITQEMFNGNEAGKKPQINIKGYMIGNPLTDRIIDFNSRIPYAYGVALLSRQLYESVKEHCSGDYMNPRNALCTRDLGRVDKCLEDIYESHILEPICESSENTSSSRLLLTQLSEPWCRDDNYVFAGIWANNEHVQKAFGIRQGTINEWEGCNTDHYLFGKNDTDTYSYNIESSIVYHINLTNKNCRALIYSGDHDMVFPHIGTERWIDSLNLAVESTWQPWFVEHQVAGYESIYSHKDYSLTFTTIKDAGHTAPEYKPKECLAMVERWFSHNSLRVQGTRLPRI